MAYLVINRHSQGDENNIVTAFVMTAFGTLVIEAAVYINMKARARLFLKARTSKQQQRQLLDLLDAIPDSVLLCTKEEGGGQNALTSVYANLKMNNLFG